MSLTVFTNTSILASSSSFSNDKKNAKIKNSFVVAKSPPFGKNIPKLSSRGDGSMVVKARNEKDEQTSFFADPYSKPVVRGKDHTPFDDFVWFAIRGYQKEFHLANLTLFLTEFGLYKFAQTLEPITTGKCADVPTAFGFLYTSVTKPMPDEVGFVMLFAGLACTGYYASLAMKNSRICKTYLLEHGLEKEDLEGMPSYNVLRYAELLVRENKVGQAKEYLRKQREECDFFIHGYTNGEKKYKMPGADLFGK